MLAPGKKLELHHHGDLPARSGIGSSSSFAVGLIHALRILQGNDTDWNVLAKEAIFLEQVVLGENVGSQDQIATAHGGINYIKFGPGRAWQVDPLRLESSQLASLESHIVLMYSGIQRTSSDISAGLIRGMGSKENRSLMTETVSIAEEALRVLATDSSLEVFPELLNENWRIKSLLNPASVTPVMREFYDKGMKHGAEGAKVLGAGGGGFFLFWVPPERQENFLFEMGPVVRVPIKISQTGSRRIL